MSHKCIVPYPSKQISNSNKVTKVDKTRFDKLIKAKNARVNSELSSISSSSSAVGSSGSSVAQPKRCHEKDSAVTA